MSRPSRSKKQPRKQKRGPPKQLDTRRASGYDVPQTEKSVVDTCLIPDLRPLRVNRYVYRYYRSAGDPILGTQSWTTQMLLDEFAMSMGSGTARRIFNAIKLRRIELWSNAPTLGGGLEFEFSPATVAGTAGSFRVPVICSKLQSATANKNQHLLMRPTSDDLAGKVFTSQQSTYVLWNCVIPGTIGSVTSETILEIEFDAVFWNGDGSPYATAYSSSSAAGTIGIGNFSGSGMTGWRVQGWSNLATP
jgi:hypothetical protein